MRCFPIVGSLINWQVAGPPQHYVHEPIMQYGPERQGFIVAHHGRARFHLTHVRQKRVGPSVPIGGSLSPATRRGMGAGLLAWLSSSAPLKFVCWFLFAGGCRRSLDREAICWLWHGPSSVLLLSTHFGYRPVSFKQHSWVHPGDPQ